MKNFTAWAAKGPSLLNNPSSFAVFFFGTVFFCRISNKKTHLFYIPSFGGGGYVPNVSYIYGGGEVFPPDLVMIRKFVQDDTSHSGTPLNPQGSREHQLLGSPNLADVLE